MNSYIPPLQSKNPKWFILILIILLLLWIQLVRAEANKNDFKRTETDFKKANCECIDVKGESILACSSPEGNWLQIPPEGRCKVKAGEIDMLAIRTIESNNNPYAVNEKTHCYGAFQISYICLEEYNKLTNHNYTILDLYYYDTNYQIAYWYFHKRLPQMMSWFGIPINTTNLIASYNWGVGNVNKWYKAGARWNKLPKEAQNYIKKYHQLSNKQK